MINGEPVAEPLIHFAAIPTFFMILALTVLLSILLFLGLGLLVFFVCVFIALTLTAIIAPYFGPMLVIVFLIIVLTSFSYGNQDGN